MILRGENMIKTTSMLLEELSSYANPKSKLSRMVDAGDCVRISKGLITLSPDDPSIIEILPTPHKSFLSQHLSSFVMYPLLLNSLPKYNLRGISP